MKIYEQKPIVVTRVAISKLGEKSIYITLDETTVEEVIEFIKNLVETEVKASPFATGPKTSVAVREYVDSKNGKSTSLSFRGIEPMELRELFLSKIQGHE